MLANWLRKLFCETDSTSDDSKVTLAAIGLIIEVAHADQQCSEDELAHLRSFVVDHFDVRADQLDHVIADALEDHDNRVSIQPLTRLINETFTVQQKTDLLRAMWKIALSDGHLQKYEEGTIRKIADLLYIPHLAYIRAKLRAAEELTEVTSRRTPREP
jgi:uncharacterized tellurite resistance protein B-like protein